jgi:hypothetical protein
MSGTKVAERIEPDGPAQPDQRPATSPVDAAKQSALERPRLGGPQAVSRLVTAGDWL